MAGPVTSCAFPPHPRERLRANGTILATTASHGREASISSSKACRHAPGKSFKTVRKIQLVHATTLPGHAVPPPTFAVNPKAQPVHQRQTYLYIYCIFYVHFIFLFAYIRRKSILIFKTIKPMYPANKSIFLSTLACTQHRDNSISMSQIKIITNS